MTLDLDLDLRIFYPGDVDPVDLVDYDLAFDLWHEVWVETRLEVEAALPTYSDSFSRQDEIIVLQHRGLPIATCCYRYVDLRRRCAMLDSYFSPDVWPEVLRARVPTLGNMCALGSHVFVRPDFRGRRAGVSIRDVMCTLSLMRVERTAPDLMLGMVRTDRGMDRVFRDNGAVTLAHSRWHHLPVDLIAVFPGRSPVVVDPRCADVVRAVVDSSDDFRDTISSKRGKMAS